MRDPKAKSHPALSSLTAASFATVAMLAACGGGSSTPVASAPAAPSALSGSVAVGAPITDGKLRVLDANGDVVAQDIAIDENGHYADVTLSGPAPYRIEACGYAGPNYLCMYSVASDAGTANVTPLTTAMMLLASGQAPDSLMSGTAPSLTTASIASAQSQLRSGLSSLITSAGLSSTVDFVSADLNAGSRTGYDGLLDVVGVNLGEDAKPFVQITPRIGEGNLYLEQGTTSGTVNSNASAASLQLSGVEALFANMTNALVSADACSHASTGLASHTATTARMSMDDTEAAVGPAAVAAGLCAFFGDSEAGPQWGAKLLSPTLGRCFTNGASPVCSVSFTLMAPSGDIIPVGETAVTQEGGMWKFYGDLLPISLHASAKAQRTKRIDTATPVYDYNRALAFDVQAVPGLACAKVSQLNSDGVVTTIGYYKRHPGATEQKRLSLWTPDGMSWGPSLDPMSGQTRSADDTWIALPEGVEGDAVVRNFYRGGRNVNVALYSDASCSTPFAIDGRDNFDVKVEGVPPIWSAMEALPWPELDAPTIDALRAFALEGGATGSFSAAWNFTRGPLGVNGTTLCGSRASCGEGGTGRLGERDLRASARSATLPLHNIGESVGANDDKTLAVYGRTGDGMDLQSNYSSCPNSVSSDSCH